MRNSDCEVSRGKEKLMEFDRLQAALASYDQGQLNALGLCQAWRSESALLARLPERYGQVLEDILQRMESSALFSEESCSFSQTDLRASLQTWLERASAWHAQRVGA